MLSVGSTAWQTRLYGAGVKPAKIIAINISEEEIKKGKQMALQSGSFVEFKVMDAHKLTFEDSSFDTVFGRAIIHHLDLEVSLKGIQRVLVPSGFILFEEPLNINPIYKLYRYFNKNQRTEDEKALTLKELNIISKYFDSSSFM